MKLVAADFVMAIVGLLALAACERGTSGSAPSGQAAATAPPPTTAAPPAAASSTEMAQKNPPADESDGNLEIALVADGDPDSGEAPLHVSFTADPLLDADLEQAVFTWDFGDDSPPSHERNPEHTYTKPGEYLATVQITNGRGEQGWDEVDIEVEAHELPAGTQ